MKSINILPTNTSPGNLAELSRTTETLKELSSWIQLDLADGVFVPVVSWPYQSGQWEELENLGKSKLPFSDSVNYEVHLMVQEPLQIGELLARAGAKRILGHIETLGTHGNVHKAFAAWKGAGASEVGLAVLMETPISEVLPLVPQCDVIQLMSIAILGRQGAPYEPGVIERIQQLHEAHPELIIEVDGGVTLAHIADLARAGVSRFGVGSAITKAADPVAAYQALKSTAESAIQ
ncbi:hypothetical protein C4585_00315 [Candidatus Parcubacteria bacterium]|nr:MAG: hypothetical protein C4585_00315 [Candidatus Parcubacteria bacterium]